MMSASSTDEQQAATTASKIEEAQQLLCSITSYFKGRVVQLELEREGMPFFVTSSPILSADFLKAERSLGE